MFFPVIIVHFLEHQRLHNTKRRLRGNGFFLSLRQFPARSGARMDANCSIRAEIKTYVTCDTDNAVNYGNRSCLREMSRSKELFNRVDRFNVLNCVGEQGCKRYRVKSGAYENGFRKIPFYTKRWINIPTLLGAMLENTVPKGGIFPEHKRNAYEWFSVAFSMEMLLHPKTLLNWKGNYL